MTYPVALLRLFSLKLPYAVTLQEGDTFAHVFNRWYIKIFESILLFGIRNAKIIQSISNFLANWAKQKGFTGKVVLVPNAVNTKHFMQAYSAQEIKTAQEEIGKKAGDVFMVTTSRLVHKNAIDDVVRAIALLPENVHFLVYGTGPDEDLLKNLTKELGIKNRVHLLGHIDHAVMPKYLKACDIFIRPSRSEGMGNSFVEAMAAGLPVIATQEGGIADFLFDEKRNPEQGTTGWAVDADSPEQIAQAVKDIISRPEKVAEVTARAKLMAIEKYDWDLIAKRMKNEVFDKLWDK
jgi:glycosyltransferase involved in cell wall biosynthesis